MNERHMGSSFENFLKEEGIYEEVTWKALQKINVWIATKDKELSNYFMKQHDLLFERIDFCGELNTQYEELVRTQAVSLQKYRKEAQATIEYAKKVVEQELTELRKSPVGTMLNYPENIPEQEIPYFCEVLVNPHNGKTRYDVLRYCNGEWLCLNDEPYCVLRFAEIKI